MSIQDKDLGRGISAVLDSSYQLVDPTHMNGMLKLNINGRTGETSFECDLKQPQ